jgi:hypothetical protein
MQLDTPSTRRVIRGDDPFDLPAAQRVARALAAGDGSPAEVDLRHVREFHDHGVAFLAQAIAASAGRVSVRGLRQHHLRLLRYLGIAAGTDLGLESEAA